MIKAKRTGISLKFNVNDCPKSTYLTLGFSEEQAARMMAVRRVLPIVEDRKVPVIDARTLWEQLGKPHGRFRDWADFYIKPLMDRPGIYAEISAKFVGGGRGRPSQEYHLSRDLSAHLAMMANTSEGHAVREYFLDMEEAILRLSRYLPLRAERIIQLDNDLTHAARKQAGEAAKSGLIPKGVIRPFALENEKEIKRFVCLLLTGLTTREWECRMGKRIRDSLSADDLEVYLRCYDMTVSLFKAGITKEEALRNILAPTFEKAINTANYMPKESA